MKRTFFLLIICFISIVGYSQVGINTTTPHSSAALDIKSTNQGLLIPRMTTTEKTNISNPSNGLLVYDTTLKCVSQNIGTPAAPSWVCLAGNDRQRSFFYMPSVTIDASAKAQGAKLDLYGEYKKQFTSPLKNPSAPVDIPYFISSTDLYYYVTKYDSNVIDNISISNEGVMTYDIKNESDYRSFITVVFVPK